MFVYKNFWKQIVYFVKTDNNFFLEMFVSAMEINRSLKKNDGLVK